MLDQNDLPVHPYTGLTAIGVLPSGRPVWPVLGGAPDSEGENEDAEGGEGDGTGSGDGAQADLGDAGKRALDKERAARKEAERKHRETAAKLKEYTDKDASAEEKLAQQQRDSADRITALTKRATAAEVRALAGEFADPEDAAAFLDLGKYADGDGDIDIDTIKADLADLLKRKPHLKRRGLKPDLSQGGGRSDSEPTLAQQIAEAEKKGDLQAAIRLKNRQLTEARAAAS
jgi:hypothetical protein